ncbi:MAG: cell division protein ZapA [Elusimicrobia bacterium]|nr:cell division protein ZapA [Elusimicrobiota bacterium]
MPSGGDFEARICNRNMKFPAVDGLTQIEQSSIVGQVEAKIKSIETKMKIADSSKLAILAAYDFAVELYNLKQRSETNLTADSKKIDEMVDKLRKTLGEVPENGE